MECTRRRTLASVFTLLLPHSFLCQNVVQTGPPLSLMKEPLRDCVAVNPGPNPQQKINLLPPNCILTEFVPQSQILPEYRQIPERLGPGYSQPVLCAGSPANIAQAPHCATFVIPQINVLPQIQCLKCNALPTAKIPASQTPPSNIKSTPLIPNTNKPFTTPIIETPIQEISRKSFLPSEPITRCPKFDITTDTNLPILQGPKILQVPIPNIQHQKSPCSQIPLGPIKSALNMPSAAQLQNQNILTLPLASNTHPQFCTQAPVNANGKINTDLMTLRFLPTPNLPLSVPIQNSASVSPASVQPMSYPTPLFPVGYASNVRISPNCQISDLPPVFPAMVPLLNNNFCRSCKPITEENTPVPINLHINVPCPVIPEPHITIIAAYPPPPPIPVPSDSSDVSFGPFDLYSSYPLPPIIIEGKKSRSKSWLPLILIALIANDGCCGGNCCCCCPCSSSGSNIPIPYPIPIPTNNPIIVGSKSKTRNKGSKKND